MKNAIAEPRKKAAAKAKKKRLVTDEEIRAALRKVGFDVNDQAVRQAKKLLERRGFGTEVNRAAVADAKAQIVAGTFETPDKVDVAVDKLMRELFPEG
jgi:repressor of nif and glnA expression